MRARSSSNGCDVHGLPLRSTAQAMVDGYPRQVWVNETGEELIESYTIPQMAHGTPLATGEADHECGAAGPFLLEAGISSSYHIARFFHLTRTRLHSVGPASREIGKIAPETGFVREPAAPGEPSPILEGEVLDPEDRTHLPPLLDIDVGAVINKALKAAGLIKSG
jgi:hypothetical protein